MPRRWLRFALFAQIALAIYFQLVVWIPLGRWNYQPGNSALLDQAINGTLSMGDAIFATLFALPLLLYSIAYRRKFIWLMWVGLAGYSAWLYLQVQTWWVNYIFGASESWMGTYDRVFGQSTKILPSFGRHLAPDAMHFVLQLLLVLVVVSLCVGLLSLRTEKRRRPVDSETRRVV